MNSCKELWRPAFCCRRFGDLSIRSLIWRGLLGTLSSFGTVNSPLGTIWELLGIAQVELSNPSRSASMKGPRKIRVQRAPSDQD